MVIDWLFENNVRALGSGQIEYPAYSIPPEPSLRDYHIYSHLILQIND